MKSTELYLLYLDLKAANHRYGLEIISFRDWFERNSNMLAWQVVNEGS